MNKIVLEKDKNFALLTHLSGFGSHFFPMGSILFPFIIRELKKDESEFTDIITKDVVNFNLSYLLYTIAVKLLVVPLFIGSVFENTINYFPFTGINIDFNCDSSINFGSILGILAIIKFVLIVKAVISSNKGEYYKYPYTIKFIK